MTIDSHIARIRERVAADFPIERLLRKCRADGECLVFTSAIEKNGYAKFWYDGKSRWVHRFAYQLYHGAIEPGNHVDHICFNTLCIRPEHIRQLTPTLNLARRRYPRTTRAKRARRSA